MGKQNHQNHPKIHPALAGLLKAAAAAPPKVQRGRAVA